MANTGDEFVRLMGRIIWWVITLIPTLLKLLYRGVVGLIHLFKKNPNTHQVAH